jgi:sulfite exporter TauE/SafE
VNVTPLFAFVVGLMSILHCLGMCGSIISALTLSLPQSVRSQRRLLLTYLAVYNLGRVGSYALAGALAGGLGKALAGTLALRHGHLVLSLLGACIMAGIGLYLAGWFPRFAELERIGTPLWSRLEPLARRLTPVNSLPQAFLFGAVWGWLPCGLVYSALIWSTTSGGAVEGALLMLAFGLGTVPAVYSAGVLMNWLARLARRPYMRQAVGISLLVMAFFMLAWSLGVETEGMPEGVRSSVSHLNEVVFA